MDTLFVKPPAMDDAVWIATLEAWRMEAINDLRLGKAVTYAGSGGVQFSNQITNSPAARVEQLTEALAIYDPDNYGAQIRVTRTTPRFL